MSPARLSTIRVATTTGILTLVSLQRRRLALVLLSSLPLALYAASHDFVGRSARALLFGVSWAVSTVAFFAMMEARAAQPRIIVAGGRPLVMLAGRVGALVALGWGLAAVYGAVVIIDQPIRHPARLVVDLLVTAVIAVALGAAVGSVLRRELDGVLVLFFVAGLQATVNPADTIAKALPFWSSRELGTVAIDGVDAASFSAGLTHAVITLGVLSAVTLATHNRRI